MKKYFVPICFSVFFWISTAMADRLTYDETKTQIAPKIDTPPTIDGVIDFAGGESWIRAGGAYGDTGGSWWHVRVDLNIEDEIRGGAIGDGAGSAPFDDTDQSADFYVAYDDSNLYIAVRVVDDFIETDSAAADSSNTNTWEDDSVEVFVDGDNSNLDTRDTSGTNAAMVGSGGQYVITANNAHRDAEAGSPGYGANAAWYAKTSLTDNGYDAEFRISMSEIGNPKPGDIIGFTVAVNDDDDSGPGERQLIWIGSPHTEATYGNLLIGHRSYSAPKTAAPNVDGTINAAEYPGAAPMVVTPFTGVYDLPSGDDTFTPDNHSFTAWVVHDNDAVYIAVDVVDDLVVTNSAAAGSEDGSTWTDDSVEVFFDPDDSNDGGRGSQPFEGQYVLTPNGAWRDAEANNPTFGVNDDWFGAISLTATGYQIEFKVTKFALIDPADGTTMGFMVAINEDDGTDRIGQLSWDGRAHSEWTYGNLTLASGGTVPVSEWSLY